MPAAGKLRRTFGSRPAGLQSECRGWECSSVVECSSSMYKGSSRSPVPSIHSEYSRNPIPGSEHTLMPLVSSSSNEPISKASAALTSPRGGIRGGGY